MKIIALLAVSAIAVATTAHAEEYELTLKNHLFSPTELTVPANTKITLTVKNADATPAEFESHDLKREKVIKGGKSAVIKLGPLKPGRYAFEDEFHDDTAKGTIIVQ
jgi:Cupredoxin-like domain